MSRVGEIRQLAKAQAGATHRKGKSPTKRRRAISAIFRDKRKFVATKELSVFVDESGSFDADCFPSRFYVVSLVFHDQTIDVSSMISDLEQSLAGSGFPGICIHVGPIIRREDEFRKMEIGVRRRLLYKMTVFARKAPVMCRSFCVDKRYPTILDFARFLGNLVVSASESAEDVQRSAVVIGRNALQQVRGCIGCERDAC